MKLKARIAPHGNEDSMKYQLRSDCSQCTPTGIRVLLSLATLYEWRISKIDVTSAFLQTGHAERDVHVRPPAESYQRKWFLWLLNSATYGLVNDIAKWQVHSDQILLDLGMLRTPLIPQLFYFKHKGQISVLCAKIVDDILFAGQPPDVDKLISGFNRKFTLGTIVHAPGHLRFFGLNIYHLDDYSISIYSGDKLMLLEQAPIPRTRRRQIDSDLTDIEKESYASLNSSLGWIGSTASVFCAEASSSLQQHIRLQPSNTSLNNTAH